MDEEEEWQKEITHPSHEAMEDKGEKFRGA